MKGTTLSEHQKLVKKKADSTLNKSQSDPVIVIRVDCTCHSDKDDSNRDVHNKRLNDRLVRIPLVRIPHYLLKLNSTS